MCLCDFEMFFCSRVLINLLFDYYFFFFISYRFRDRIFHNLVHFSHILRDGIFHNLAQLLRAGEEIRDIKNSSIREKELKSIEIFKKMKCLVRSFFKMKIKKAFYRLEIFMRRSTIATVNNYLEQHIKRWIS